jgi:hypothetical protein
MMERGLSRHSRRRRFLNIDASDKACCGASSGIFDDVRVLRKGLNWRRETLPANQRADEWVESSNKTTPRALQ